MKTYVKTNKLKGSTFRGQKALVVEALTGFSSPRSVEEIEKAANENGSYTKMLNEWARENGGVHASVLYHLRELEKQGLVKSAGEVDQPKVEKKSPKKRAPRRKKLSEVPPGEVADELDPLVEEALNEELVDTGTEV